MECEHLNWAETANGRYRFCADCGRDLGAVGDEDPSTLPAGGVSPTAPDEREALFRLIYGYETIDFRESQNFTTRDCYGVVDAILAAGFRRSREATTEPQPITDADVDVFTKAINAAGFVLDRRATLAGLEAVEASRSPKPTERSKP